MIIQTEELKKILNAKDFEILVIKAFAGTGKTTALREIALKNKEKKYLYIAYNKVTADSARRKFPKNVESRTAHSLAYAKYGRQLEHKLNRKTSMPFKAETIMKLFSFKRNSNNLEIARTLKKIIENYCCSTYKTIIEAVPFRDLPIDRNELAFFAELLWTEMTDKNSKFPTIPDVYLKQFVLSKPILNYDYILFDEAQDANPLILELVSNQIYNNVKLIYVGDDHQSIYQFRLAKNALTSIYADEELYLTQSFRFGDNIAKVANKILKEFKNEKNTLKGTSSIEDSLNNVDKTKQFAVISRTNSSILLNALKAKEQKKKIAFIGGFNSYNFKQIIDVEKLYLNELDKIKDPFIKSFISFNEYESQALFSNDRDMLYNIKIIKKYAGGIGKLLKEIKINECEVQNADIILTNVHKAKGLEFSQVVIANDFVSLVVKDNKLNKKITEDEINLFYVAVTRAIHRLQLNNTLIKFMELKDINMENTIEEKDNYITINNIIDKF